MGGAGTGTGAGTSSSAVPGRSSRSDTQRKVRCYVHVYWACLLVNVRDWGARTLREALLVRHKISCLNSRCGYCTRSMRARQLPPPRLPAPQQHRQHQPRQRPVRRRTLRPRASTAADRSLLPLSLLHLMPRNRRLPLSLVSSKQALPYAPMSCL